MRALAVLILLSSCVQSTTISTEDWEDMVDRVEALEAENAALQESLSTLTSDSASLSTLAAGNQERLDAIEADYLVSASLDGYATESWVSDQGYGLDADISTLSDTVAGVVADYLTSADANLLSTEIALSEALIDDLDTRISAVELDYLTSDALTGYATESWVDGQGYATESWVEDQGFLDESSLDDTVQLITADETWSISTVSELEDAMTALDYVAIASDATLTLALADGAYSMSGPLYFRHPDGGRIRVEGDVSAPGKVSLLFPSGEPGVVVEDSTALGFLGGLTLTGYGDSGGEIGEIGILVRENSMLTLGPVTISGFYGTGLYVRDSSFVQQDEAYADSSGWLTISDGYYGIYVSMGSGAFLADVEVYDALYEGLTASRGSYLFAEDAISMDSGRAGVLSTDGSYVNATGITASGNTTYGLHVKYHSGLEAAGSSISSSIYGVLADWNSTAVVNGSTISASGVPVYSYATSLVHAGTSTVSTGGTISYQQQTNGLILANGSTSGTVSSSDNEITDFVYGQ